MNPYDEFGVEEALRSRKRPGEGTVATVVCLGPQRVVESLRTALAMGADEGIHIDDLRVSDALANLVGHSSETRRIDAPFAWDSGASRECAAPTPRWRVRRPTDRLAGPARRVAPSGANPWLASKH